MLVANIYVPKSFNVATLTYLVPESFTVAVGDAVIVPLGKQQVEGLVINLYVQKIDSNDNSYKSITSVIGHKSSKNLIDVANSISEAYFTPRQHAYKKLYYPGELSAVSPEEEMEEYSFNTSAPQLSFKARKSSNFTTWVKSPSVSYLDAVKAEIGREPLEGRQVLIVCPTLSLAEELLHKFSSGACLISKPSKRKTGYQDFLQGKYQIGITTRLGTFLQDFNLGKIILLDDTHLGHLAMSQPYVHSNDVLYHRAKAQNCTYSVISTCPSVSTIQADMVVGTIGEDLFWPSLKVLYQDQEAAVGRVPDSLYPLMATHEGPVTVVPSPVPSKVICTKCSTIKEILKSLPETITSPCTICGTTTSYQVGFDKEVCQETFRSLIQEGKINLVELADLHYKDFEKKRMVVLVDIGWSLQNRPMTSDLTLYQTIARGLDAVGKEGTLVVIAKTEATALSTLLKEKSMVAQLKRSWVKAKEQGLTPFHTILKLSSNKQTPRLSSTVGMQYGPKKVPSGYEKLIILNKGQEQAFKVYLETLKKMFIKYRISKL